MEGQERAPDWEGVSGTVGEKRRDEVLMRLDETWELQPFLDYPG